MKTKSTIWVLAAALGLCMALESCHKDTKIAMKLSGKWQGEWGMYYRDNEGNEFDAYNSVVEFIPNEKYDTRGTGYQVDYYYTDRAYPNGKPSQYDNISYYFEWEVINKTIYLRYPHAPKSEIRDYKLKKEHFYGHFNNSATEFDLRAISKVYRWSDYANLNLYTAYEGVSFLCWLDNITTPYYYYNYNSYRPGYYWAKTRDANGQEDPEKPAIQLGNRYLDGMEGAPDNNIEEE